MAGDFLASAPFPYAAPNFVGNSQLRANLRRATTTIREKRNRVVAELPDFEDLRQAAAAIKDDALSRLDDLLEEVERNVIAAGGHVHFAADAAEANETVVRLVGATQAHEVVKVKSMTTAEIRLNEALGRAGVEAAETDLAELIVQLGNDLPSHIVVPAIHRNRAEVREIFLAHMGEHGLPAPEDLDDAPASLAGAARAHLRQRFLRAKVGISGANFVVADSGSVVVVESEGNGRMCVTLPEVLITVAGIDKVLPRFSDLEVFLQLLARSATGERMNPYTSIWSGVSEGDGPRQFHLVLVDNGRSLALGDRVGRQALRCIRCAACLNVCPVYERVGGHAYGSVYPGPIGAVLTPQLKGVATDQVAASLPYASTLCGACYEVCPVRIDIPRLLVHLRARTVEERRGRGPSLEALTMAAASVAMSSPRRMATLERLAGWLAAPLRRRGKSGPLPGPLRHWTAARDAPLPARQSFRDWWASDHSPSRSGPSAGVRAGNRSGPSAGVRAGNRSGPSAGVWAGNRSGPSAGVWAGPSRPGLGFGYALRALLPGPAAASRAASRRRPEARELPGLAGRMGREGVLGGIGKALREAPFAAVDIPRKYHRAGEAGVTEPVPLFVSRLTDYKAEVRVVVGYADIAPAVGAALAARASRRVIVPTGLPPEWLAALDGTEVVRDHGELGPYELDRLDAAVTACAVAIASTGTIVLDGGAAQGRRALSL
ncbi:MAG TPA: LutB/LldF family L-lactate oxidation iron-sulfur protein, partial [Acidimicrobiales bacterium]|nr:LutB/LldF family L-lactate oxidation iron-sulfur protein [Acidimicrobiales bacterium]